MIHLYNDYYFKSDGSRNLVLLKKKIITGEGSKGTKAKAENIGKEKYEEEGYFYTLEGLLNGLATRLQIDLFEDPKIKDLETATKRMNKLMHDVAQAFNFTVYIDGEQKTVTAKQIRMEI